MADAPTPPPPPTSSVQRDVRVPISTANLARKGLTGAKPPQNTGG